MFYDIPEKRITFNKNKLPTKLEVLGRLLFCISPGKMSLNDACKLVVDEVMDIWQKIYTTRIFSENRTLVTSLKRLHGRYYGVFKNSNRDSKAEKNKRSKLMKFLAPIWNIECSDNRKRAKLDIPSTSAAISSDSDVSSNVSDPSFIPPVPVRKRPQKKAFGMTPHLAAALDRTGTSDRDASLLILATADSCGVDVSQVCASHSNVRRNRMKNRQNTFDQEREKLIRDSSNANFVLHWDGKKMLDTTNNRATATDYKVERLAILLSNGKDTYILNVPKLTSGHAVTHFNAIKDTLDGYDRIKNRIKGMCFDNTNVNTGDKEGVCVRLRKEFDNYILTFSCRLHIFDLVLSRVFSATLDETTESPNIKLFVDFKKTWDDINPAIFEPGINENLIDSAFVNNERRDLIDFLRNQLEIQKPDRHDYIELMQLSILFLGGEGNFRIRAPGAVHRARFMMKAILALKICLLRGQLEIDGNFLSVH